MSNTPSTKVPTATLAENLTALAEFLRTKNLPRLPYITTSAQTGSATGAWLLFGNGDGEDEKAEALAIVRAVGGSWKKEDTSELFWFKQEHPRFKFEVVVNRAAVCERVVTGTREVERVVPAVVASPERVLTETVEDVRWDCTPLLAEAKQVTS